MATLKLTKNELRLQQNRYLLLGKYLPTLQLKKALLQTEISEAAHEIERFKINFERLDKMVKSSSAVLTDWPFLDISKIADIQNVQKHYENIAGVEVPYFEAITFNPFEYTLFDTPVWIDQFIAQVRELVKTKTELEVAHEKKRLLEKELREVSIRVNLFEKILIPRAESNIKKIKLILADQQLAAVARAKVAKSKIEASKSI